MIIGTSITRGYRPNVDGLRALAVIAVIGFHAFPEIMPGGFVGVDVFFVISGFLISGIIFNQLSRGTFTFRGFYDRRIRRIFPALSLVLTACLIYGWWAALPVDFRQLGEQVAAGAGFVSNILLWRQSDYFDTASELKPLLHLWSLGVEEQYYLIWPLLLFLLRRHVRAMIWVILAIAAASFALNIVATTRYPTAAFYLPMTRFWELMIGSGIAYLKRSPPYGLPPLGTDPITARLTAFQQAIVGFIGLALIATTVEVLDPNHPFPGWWALPPTVGTALLVSISPNSWFNRQILERRPLVYLGLISYPLYLWHWPLLAFLRLYVGGEPSILARVSAVFASIVLASLTYEFLEKRVRHLRPAHSALRPATILTIVMALLGVYGMLAFYNYSRSRSDAVPLLAQISAAFGDWSYRGETAIHGTVNGSVLFFGDSHMEQYLPRIEQIMWERRAPVHSVLFRTRHGCAPIPQMERTGRHCSEFVTAALQLAHSPGVETVIIGASWVGFANRDDYYQVDARRGSRSFAQSPDVNDALKRFEGAIRDLTADGKRVVIILSLPRGGPFDPRNMVHRIGFSYRVKLNPPVLRTQIVADNAFIDDQLKSIAARVGADVIDPMNTFCTALVCPTITDDGRPLFMDESHLRSSIVREEFDALDGYVYAAED